MFVGDRYDKSSKYLSRWQKKQLTWLVLVGGSSLPGHSLYKLMNNNGLFADIFR